MSSIETMPKYPQQRDFKSYASPEMTPVSWACVLCCVLAVPVHCALPRVFLPAPEPLPPMDGRICADPTPFLALILVMSHPDNVAKRQAMRDVYPDWEIADLGFRRTFVVGFVTARHRVEPTGELDFLRVNATDTYDTLANKVLSALSWAAKSCPHARFIAKADDDMFIDFYSLSSQLAAIDDDAVHEIRGHLNRDTINLTPYLAGGFYATSPRTCTAIVKSAERTDMFLHVAEDVYVTGVLADKVSAKRVDFPAVRHWEGAPHCCLDVEGGVVYACQYGVFEDRHGMSGAHARRFKAHGRFCYFFKCEKFTGALLGEPGLTCFR